ncbi:hypothetical protein BDZ91DRAFT_714601 [Kalaharituber pfeilii]|nr:hypothetical protein BDZ91DRAFT_714601 [Kalaharituber pfeilii]
MHRENSHDLLGSAGSHFHYTCSVCRYLTSKRQPLKRSLQEGCDGAIGSAQDTYYGSAFRAGM